MEKEIKKRKLWDLLWDLGAKIGRLEDDILDNPSGVGGIRNREYLLDALIEKRDRAQAAYAALR